MSHDINFTRLWRAHVTPSDWRGTEDTAFAEAGTREAAIRKMARAIAAIEYRRQDELSARIYNLTSAAGADRRRAQ
jgi:hypothetical protein